jgi:SAM-dependent methyltransferase
VNSTTRAFDRLAPQYDAIADGELFRIMREQTHKIFARWFRAGSRVLEIGCGTGLDTAFLVSQGARVVACDPSEEMVGRTLCRLASHGAAGANVMPCGLESVEMFLEALGEREPFDVILSNFGALNCVACLEALRSVVARVLRPGGAVLLGVMGRSCAMEAIYFTLTGRASLINRRRAFGAVSVPVAGVDVATYFHRTGDIAAALAPDLVLSAVTGIGVAIPPPYLERRWQTVPAFVRMPLTAIDSAIAPWPPFNRFGDHVLLQFVKRVPADG